MQLQRYVLALGLSVLVPATLAAQSQTPSGGATTTTTQQPGGATTTTTQTQSPTPSDSDSFLTRGVNHWMASGFIGSNYSNNSASLSSGTDIDNDAESSVDFGGSVGYLWRGVVGGEFLANFTPNFSMDNALLASTSTPSVNSYMFNLVAAAPFGADGNWQPFVSGGFGAVTLTADENDFDSTVSGTFDTDENRAGGNIGFGLMAFMGGWGIRGDIRYFRALESDDTTTTTVTNPDGTIDASESVQLPGLTFWRANIGLAFRW